jgi:hypothetical protein
LLGDTDDIGIHSDGESTRSSDETYFGPREKILVDEIINFQKPSGAITSSILPANKEVNKLSEWIRICGKILAEDSNAAKN